tara:strand:+ start:53 stop:1495 length:1443 start_codon:yes stop_codon:yes gene_type:complete
VAQDKGIIGSVASRIQKSMRESDLAEKRREARMDANAEIRKQREEIAETVDPAVQAEMAMMTPQQAQEVASNYAGVREGLAAARAGEPMPLSTVPFGPPLPAPAPAPAAAPVEVAAAAPQAAGVAPGPQMPAGLQDWHKPTKMFPPRADLADAPQFQPPEAPTTRPDWPPTVFTFTELMSQARGARTDEEFDRVAAQLGQVVKDDPAMGGGSIAEIISGVSRRDHSGLRMNLMNSYVGGQKQRAVDDPTRAYGRMVDAHYKLNMMGYRQADLEARAKKNAAAAKRAQDRGYLNSADKQMLDWWGAFVEDADNPGSEEGTRFPAKWKGKKRGEIFGQIIQKTSGAGKANDRMAGLLKSVLTAEQRDIEPYQQKQMDAIQRAQNSAVRRMEDMAQQMGLLENIVDADDYRELWLKARQQVRQLQGEAEAKWKRYNLPAGELANLTAGVMGVLDTYPEDPGDLTKEGKAKNRKKENPDNAPKR